MRPHKNKKKSKNQRQGQKTPIVSQKMSTNANTSVSNISSTPQAPIAVTKPTKSGTIAAIDYFGFPASVFSADLKRTGWATLVILAILAAITVVTRVS